MSPDQHTAERIVIVAGMPRAATTFLYHTLASHPQVCIPPRKEIEYFTLNHYRGTEWYLSFFDGAAEDAVGFDISPVYFMDLEVPSRIREFNPDAKVVLLIRDPVEFVLSLYAQRLGTTYKPPSFEEFLAGYTYAKDGRTIEFVFDAGRIRETIERFRSTFGANLLLCSYEIVRRDPLPVLKAIEAFVGIPSYFGADNFENVRVNASDQRNIVWLNWLMQRKWFADLVVRLAPKRLILQVRYWLQTRRHSDPEPRESAQPDPNKALAEQRFAEDQRYVRELFQEADFLLGTGEPASVDSLRG